MTQYVVGLKYKRLWSGEEIKTFLYNNDNNVSIWFFDSAPLAFQAAQSHCRTRSGVSYTVYKLIEEKAK